MSKPNQLPVEIEKLSATAVKPRVLKPAVRVERPPDKKVQVVHVYQWHLIIKALWPYALLLAVIFGLVHIPFLDIAKLVLSAG